MILVKSTSSFEPDELLEKAAVISIKYDKVAASLLQRRLRVGYARASKLIHQMEQIGIVSVGDGYKPRRILTKKPSRSRKTVKYGAVPYLSASFEMTRQILLAHGIRVKLSSIKVTPKAIHFLMESEVGTKLDRILELHKEIAMGLASPTGRVEIRAPLKGTSLVDIVLPTSKVLVNATYHAIHIDYETRTFSDNLILNIRYKIKYMLADFAFFMHRLSTKI